ncbi:MAG TPA: hypothetical protein VGI41_06645, partial [Candidatus Udaeobacter sp.]
FARRAAHIPFCRKKFLSALTDDADSPAQYRRSPPLTQLETLRARLLRTMPNTAGNRQRCYVGLL